jgi:hypothetical protein
MIDQTAAAATSSSSIRGEAASRLIEGASGLNMDLTAEYEPIVLLNDSKTFTGLGRCELIVLTLPLEDGRPSRRRDHKVEIRQRGTLPPKGMERHQYIGLATRSLSRKSSN